MRQMVRRGYTGPIVKYMSQTSISDFHDWNYFFEQEERERLRTNDKQDHYFALIALKIQHIAEMFSDSKKRSELKDYLLKFTSGETETMEPKKVLNPYKPPSLNEDGSIPEGWIDVPVPGEDGKAVPVLDERWQKRASDAKATFAAMFAAAGMTVEGMTEMLPSRSAPVEGIPDERPPGT